MNSQKQYWNDLHAKGDLHHYSESASSFAEEVLAVIPNASTILELGSGTANDGAAFARAGNTVLATDFSDAAIEKNREHWSGIKNISFERLDISEPMRFSEESFDVVYARLALHYFTDEITKNIFAELRRILKPNGYFFFMCKSTKDPLYGEGTEIEKDMFDRNGHIRHFFSEEYAAWLLADGFKIIKIESGEEPFYEKKSAFVKVTATKIG